MVWSRSMMCPLLWFPCISILNSTATVPNSPPHCKFLLLCFIQPLWANFASSAFPTVLPLTLVEISFSLLPSNIVPSNSALTIAPSPLVLAFYDSHGQCSMHAYLIAQAVDTSMWFIGWRWQEEGFSGLCKISFHSNGKFSVLIWFAY